jgi:hypothetical protein
VLELVLGTHALLEDRHTWNRRLQSRDERADILTGRVAAQSPVSLLRQNAFMETVTLWRPTGPEELALLEASGWREWPPRLPDQPIFYPVLNEEYATKIARDWNVKASGVGYVTRFDVDKTFLGRYDMQQAGGHTILELHATHLTERCPEITKYLDLPAGSRFLTAPGYEDVWTDEALLDV